MYLQYGDNQQADTHYSFPKDWKSWSTTKDEAISYLKIIELCWSQES